MKALIKWCVGNSPAVNTIAIAILLIGGWSAFNLRREFWPHSKLDVIEVVIEFPGASAREVELAVCRRLEDATRNIPNVDRIQSHAIHGQALLSLELHSSVSSAEVDDTLAMVRTRVFAIDSFPDLARPPQIRRQLARNTALHVGVIGIQDQSVEAAVKLRRVAEQIRHELLLMPSVSDVAILGAPEHEINVELSTSALQAHDLSLDQVRRLIREQNQDTPGGLLRTSEEELLLKGTPSLITGDGIASIPLLSDNLGSVVTVGEIGQVIDGFSEDAHLCFINGRPGLSLQVNSTKADDILSVGRAVHEYIADKQLPAGYDLVTLLDRSREVEARLALLSKNGWQGLLLVLLLLSLFLEFRLAFWVAAGIPVALAGAAAFMYVTDQTLNMSSMFAFLIAIGIVVDDAIIVAENIHAHQKRGKSYGRAAVDGCLEVMPAVLTSVLTTAIAFLPILLMTGQAGRMTKVIPTAIIAVLLFSLAEALLVLPCHLGRKHSGRFSQWIASWQLVRSLKSQAQLLNSRVQSALNSAIDGLYLPLLRFSLHNPALILSIAVAGLIVTLGAVQTGQVPFSILPKMDWNFCTAVVRFPEGTPRSITEAATRRLEDAIVVINEEIAQQHSKSAQQRSKPAGKPVSVVERTVGHGTTTSGLTTQGSHVGSVTLQLVDSSQREITSQELVARWRKIAGEFPDAEGIQFASGPIGISQPPISFTLLFDNDDEHAVENVVAQCMQRMNSFTGLCDVSSNLTKGKTELNVRLRPAAHLMGVRKSLVDETLHAAIHGQVCMRLQRDGHEVALRVRHVADDRSDFNDIEKIDIYTDDNIRRPLSEIASVEFTESLSEVRRTNQMRAITIDADVNRDVLTTREAALHLQDEVFPELKTATPGLRIEWDGERAQTRESMKRMRYGFLAVMCAMYTLLTIQFRSYVQPLLILLVIPFASIGAIGGHALMGISLTLFSIYGLVALAGVVINDSIVLVDFFNRSIAAGMSIENSILEAGRRRFRPVFLTSITTVICLVPIMFETSRQAQALKPMAVSLAFGICVSTILVLILIPSIVVLISSSRNPSPSNSATDVSH